MRYLLLKMSILSGRFVGIFIFLEKGGVEVAPAKLPARNQKSMRTDRENQSIKSESGIVRS